MFIFLISEYLVEYNGFSFFFLPFSFQGHALVQLSQTVPDVKIFGVASKSKHEALQDKGITHLLERGSDYVSEVRKWASILTFPPEIGVKQFGLLCFYSRVIELMIFDIPIFESVSLWDSFGSFKNRLCLCNYSWKSLEWASFLVC